MILNASSKASVIWSLSNELPFYSIYFMLKNKKHRVCTMQYTIFINKLHISNNVAILK